MRVQVLTLTTALLLSAAVPVWAADVTGSYDGQLVVKKQPAIASSATFTQAGKFVTGTLVLAGAASVGGGAFLVTGKLAGKTLTVKGALGAVRVTYMGKLTGTKLKGKATVKGAKRSGTLTLTLNPPLTGGAGCDAVYAAHQMQFDTDLFQAGGVLSLCTQCHIPGGQAQSTRFQVAVADELATARSIAGLVNSADPASSRILQKPTMAIPHGGLQIIVPGSAEETKLRAWVDLIAAAHCNGS